MQTFAVFITLLVIGGKRGTTAILLYILLGIAGLPVFHSFTGGIGILTGPSGGFIYGFLLMGLCYALVTKKAGEKLYVKVSALLTGMILCYAVGCMHFALVSEVSAKTAFFTAVLPFILPDLLKLFVSILLSSRIKKISKV